MPAKSQPDGDARPRFWGRPGRVWLASWAFWLVIAMVGVGLPAHAVQQHAHAFRLWRRTFALQAGICKALAASPRPSADECWRRAGQSMVNLVAPQDEAYPR